MTLEQTLILLLISTSSRADYDRKKSVRLLIVLFLLSGCDLVQYPRLFILEETATRLPASPAE